MKNAATDILYSAICGEVNVSVSVSVEMKGDCNEKQQSCYVSGSLKSRSGRKLLDPPSVIKCNQYEKTSYTKKHPETVRRPV